MDSLAAVLAVPVALLLLAAVSSVRVVPEQHRAVVMRLGRTHRVSGPGAVLHIPLVERLSIVSLLPQRVTVVRETITRDGTPVRATGTATCAVVDPARACAAAIDPVPAMALEVEAALARAISRLPLVDLLPQRERIEAGVPAEVNPATAAWGTQVLRLELEVFETRLTAELLQCARTTGRSSDA